MKSIERWNAPPAERAEAGESIGISLEEQVFVERGEVVCHQDSKPEVSREFTANIFWMGDKRLREGATCLVKLTTQETECKIKKILRVINSSTLEDISGQSKEVAKNEVAEVVLGFKKDIVYDTFDVIEETGRLVLEDEKLVSGGGIILKK